jgi:hypothetical protein
VGLELQDWSDNRSNEDIYDSIKDEDEDLMIDEGTSNNNCENLRIRTNFLAWKMNLPKISVRITV